MPYKHGFSLELRLQHFVAAVEAVSPTRQQKATTSQFSLGQQIREHEVRALLFTRRVHGYFKFKIEPEVAGGTQ